ncbi:GNAT family N-acetyltransferase [Hymenobacter sp. BT730]|uniref:GNAT family N-acetyltransferase n=1 Tax=Hymenobacter sp. BT730 TaxID=3063332 RepID=UPI0026E01FCB|nr:GNAT family protein [Hymenobacter sp. BT730]
MQPSVGEYNNAMVTLAPLQREHVASFLQWLRDPEVIEYSLSQFQSLHTDEEIGAWFAATLAEDRGLTLGIYTHETNKLIGYAGLVDLSETNQSGEYFILIGDKAWWGKGVGTAVTKQVLALGFTQHRLNRIMLTVSEPNTGGVKAYANAGFAVEGRLRQACCRRGLFHDKLVMAVLKEEWESRPA